MGRNPWVKGGTEKAEDAKLLDAGISMGRRSRRFYESETLLGATLARHG
jgi:hypothetical protein